MRSILSLDLLMFALFIFSSCSQSGNQKQALGSLDPKAIAADTTLQVGLESYYEFHQSLVANQNLVYDVVAYGGPMSSGRFAILKRNEKNHSDTVYHAERIGIISNTFLADSNRNGVEEVYVQFSSPAGGKELELFKYEPKAKN